MTKETFEEMVERIAYEFSLYAGDADPESILSAIRAACRWQARKDAEIVCPTLGQIIPQVGGSGAISTGIRAYPLRKELAEAIRKGAGE